MLDKLFKNLKSLQVEYVYVKFKQYRVRKLTSIFTI